MDLTCGRTEAAGPAGSAESMRRIEQLEALDAAVRVAEPRAGRLVENPRMRSVLHGDATGIPLHGILTDVPFGAWFMAGVLDCRPGRAGARLVGLRRPGRGAHSDSGAGWAEWALAGRLNRWCIVQPADGAAV